MDSRERVFTALSHKEADRVPVDFWATSETFGKLQRHFAVNSKDEVLDRIGADIRYIDGPAYIGPELTKHADGTENDIWGVARKAVTVGEGEKAATYMNVTHSPLAEISTVGEAESFEHWPSLDWYDFSVIAAQCEKYRNQGRVVAFVGDRTNRVAQLKPYMYIRGVENAYMDMALNKELFNFVVSRIREFYKGYLTRIQECSGGKIDIFLTGDDFGSQGNLLCSRDDWLELLQPGFKEYMEIIKQGGGRTMHHTCGSVTPIIGDMADAGLDILQSLQPGAKDMEPERLKQQFGDVICFNGSISIQTNLPFGKPKDVKNEVKKNVESLAKNGGFIIGTAHNIQADVPLENIVALIEAYEQYLTY